jgi:hypothetical protein
MGMGYGANFAEVIADGDLEDIVGGDLLAKFNFALEAAKVSYAEFADEGAGSVDVTAAYEAIREKFGKETGLGLFIGYHDSVAYGSRYDEVDGYYWAVTGMYELSPEGQKMIDVVQRRFFVTFG